jgi:hypothetical protein
MTPPAYHRIVEQGEDTPHFHRLAGRFMLSAMVFLASGIGCDFFVVVHKITGSFALASWLSFGLLVLFFSGWFLFPFFSARRRHGSLITTPPHGLARR